MININDVTFINDDNAFVTDKETRSPNKIDVEKEVMYWHPCSRTAAIEHLSILIQHSDKLSTSQCKKYFDAYLQIIDTTTEIGFVMQMSEDIKGWQSLFFGN